ncbi:hypothetical protein BMR99_03525 [Propionibacterium freudenreichii]|uniref:DUF3168 domain-containing protein n=1 Tax=Propionibacterium freudenreichii TaxID=1744 RepID=A0A509MEB3_9ACTN|nr:hypothetical protein [Propionibacterium freudenreichii]ARO11717.1 hypothetical protein BMR99_03525 [Propionibacterium freudenreichii]SCQ79554.1 Hypothetical protein PFR_JS23_1421 [Propionibacterium freudenreichii]SCQ83208.1 Hypothetical protein PFR_JS23-PH_29 [Propionibacterium freudenreichii]SUY93587.1 Hypothetical protein PFR_JS23-PH_29 [Propionibacterium freudenreichii]
MKPPDLHTLVARHLAGILDVPVVSTRPEGETAPLKFVRIISTGGAGRYQRVFQGIQLTISSYAGSAATARDLAMQVDEAMNGLPVSPLPVSKVTGNTPSDDPDPDTQQDRYTATYQLTTIIR